MTRTKKPRLKAPPRDPSLYTVVNLKPFPRAVLLRMKSAAALHDSTLWECMALAAEAWLDLQHSKKLKGE